jgi:hypothetical protein
MFSTAIMLTIAISEFDNKLAGLSEHVVSPRMAA